MRVSLSGKQALVDYELFDTEEHAYGGYDGNYRVVPVDLVFAPGILTPLPEDERRAEINRIRAMWKESENYRRTSCAYLYGDDND